MTGTSYVQKNTVKVSTDPNAMTRQNASESTNIAMKIMIVRMAKMKERYVPKNFVKVLEGLNVAIPENV